MTTRVPKEVSQPKFRNLPPEERMIAGRISKCRRHFGITQAELAKKIDLTRDQLASIETARATLGFAVALGIAKALRISLRWLAEGIGPPLLPLAIDPELEREAAKYASFIEGYKAALKQELDKEFSVFRDDLLKDNPGISEADLERRFGLTHGAGVNAEMFVSSVLIRLGELMQMFHDGLRHDLAMEISKLLAEFEKSHQLTLDQLTELQTCAGDKTPEFLHLPNTSVFRNTLSDMKAVRTMNRLLEEVRKIAKPAGMKASLAKFLDVPQSRVSEWLSGKYEPSGDVTLRLLQWVEQQERQK